MSLTGSNVLNSPKCNKGVKITFKFGTKFFFCLFLFHMCAMQTFFMQKNRGLNKSLQITNKLNISMAFMSNKPACKLLTAPVYEKKAEVLAEMRLMERQ